MLTLAIEALRAELRRALRQSFHETCHLRCNDWTGRHQIEQALAAAHEAISFVSESGTLRPGIPVEISFEESNGAQEGDRQIAVGS